jgi:hypothetical protein
MGYELRFDGSNVTAVEYNKPGPFTRRNSKGMTRWMNRQLERDKNPIEVPGLSFSQWLKILKPKRLIIDKL